MGVHSPNPITTDLTTETRFFLIYAIPLSVVLLLYAYLKEQSRATSSDHY